MGIYLVFARKTIVRTIKAVRRGDVLTENTESELKNEASLDSTPVSMNMPEVPSDEFDTEIRATALTLLGNASFNSELNTLDLKYKKDGFRCNGSFQTPGNYQVWITYYCGGLGLPFTLRS